MPASTRCIILDEIIVVRDRDHYMTSQEAAAYISQYRALLKAWTMAVGGFTREDSDALYRELEQGQDVLAQIALEYPENSYSVDMLINSRSRTWPGFASERIPRPASRQT